MLKVKYIIVLMLALSTSIVGQNNIYELGGSINGSVMNSDFWGIPGFGFKLDHRINYAKSDFVLKNSFGLTKYSDSDIEGTYKGKGIDNLWMFDVMLEYNLFSLDKTNLVTSTKNWTPYMGAGLNFIYRETSPVPSILTGYGAYVTLKGSLGVKYRVTKRLTFTAEGYLEWDFSDDLDGYYNSPTKWYQFDHTANFSIGLIYRLNKNNYSKRR